MTLQPQHSSTINGKSKPKGMSVTKIESDSRKMIEEETLSIFTTMTNAGASLQQTLLAIYLSGMSAAYAVGVTNDKH